MSPLSSGDFLMPRFQRPFGLRMPHPKHSKSPLGDNPHDGTLARSQYGSKLPILPLREVSVKSREGHLLQGWGLIDLPLRASNEGSPRPRVARAQKIIRLHPLLYSASKEG